MEGRACFLHATDSLRDTQDVLLLDRLEALSDVLLDRLEALSHVDRLEALSHVDRLEALSHGSCGYADSRSEVIAASLL